MNPRNFLSAATAPIGLLAACALLAATLAYPVYLATDDAIGYRSLVSRGALLLVLAATYWIARHFRLDGESLGLNAGWPELLKKAGVGLLLGTAMLGLHTLVLVALDVREMDPRFLDLSRWPGVLGKALAVGLAVGLSEELMFRGVLLGILNTRAGTVAALVISAFYYSILHFLRSDWKPRGLGLDWTTGFRILGDSVAQWAHLPFDSFLALFTAGIFLACVRLVFSGGLAYCIGLHAGWVMVIKSAKSLTNGGAVNKWSVLVGQYDGIIGYLVAGWIAVLTLPLIIRLGRRHSAAVKPCARSRRYRSGR